MKIHFSRPRCAHFELKLAVRKDSSAIEKDNKGETCRCGALKPEKWGRRGSQNVLRVLLASVGGVSLECTREGAYQMRLNDKNVPTHRFGGSGAQRDVQESCEEQLLSLYALRWLA